MSKGQLQKSSYMLFKINVLVNIRLENKYIEPNKKDHHNQYISCDKNTV